MKRVLVIFLLAVSCAFAQESAATKQEKVEKKVIPLSTSKVLLDPVPGAPQQTNSFPTAMAVSPDGKYLAILNNGYGTVESKGQQSIGILDIKANELKDYPDARLGPRAAQTYFLGLAWSGDGKHIYASVASLTDPLGEKGRNTGNGIAVYAVNDGVVTPERFIKIGLQQLAPGKKSNKIWDKLPEDKAIPYPAGIAVVRSEQSLPESLRDKSPELLLVTNNLSDSAIVLNSRTGEVMRTFDLSVAERIPAAYPYSVAAVGKHLFGQLHGRGWISLWNASAIAELDLGTGKVVRTIPLRPRNVPLSVSTHPTSITLVLDTYLFVTLSNSDSVAVVKAATGKVVRYLNTRLPHQSAAGGYPNAVAAMADTVFVANASSDAIAVFKFKVSGNGTDAIGAVPGVEKAKLRISPKPIGYIPTEWYPTALALHDGELFIASGKGKGPGPNGTEVPVGTPGRREGTGRPFIASLMHGSVARVKIEDALKNLPELTKEVERSNLMAGRTDRIEFGNGKKSGKNGPIKHVIYIIKENRTYDQVFGDIKEADGDASLVMYGEDITPNQHKLARQFGVLDNFYDSGEVSGNGHVWSTAAITSDYTEKVWQIGYRGGQRTYDYEGTVANRIPMEDDIPDVNEPGTGYLWTNLAHHKRTYRHYGEYVTSRWCNETAKGLQMPQAGTPQVEGLACTASFINKGEPLPANVGEPKGGPSPYGWPIPILARDVPTKPELRGHYDPKYPDFRMEYPDQLRVDEFLNEFEGFVKARGTKQELPEFIVMRLPNDHTSGTKPGAAKPTAAVADNDLAVGRVVEAVSKSPYWGDTAIFILEDDAQDGADHVDAHRSIALVISRWSPKNPTQGKQGTPRGAEENQKQDVFVDHNFYTTVNMIHTMEVLLGLSPMNNNDARAAVMEPLFSGDGTRPAFTADYRNRENGLIYEANPEKGQGAKESAAMDFTHADSVDTALLNAILWKDRKGDLAMPKPVHTMCGKESDQRAADGEQ